jgi:nucleotide-binding universal stress UspA family protein
MKSLNKILVPVDFSKHADAAIDAAMEIAARYDASITLLNVFEPVALAFPEEQNFYAGTITADLMADRRKALEKKKDAVLAKGAKRVTVEQVQGNPAAAIKDFAADGNYDLIVMGTLGRTGVAHFFLGSVAERVVRTAACAVLTVHEHSKPFSKILVPTDFSPDSDAALDAATDLAARWQASITLVNVFQPIAHTYPTGSGIFTSLPVDHVIKDQLEALERLRQSALAKGAKQVEIVQRTGHPATEIHDLARDGGFDLIAMSTHGRSAMSRMFLGAVAERVVRTAPCPVLTLRTSGAM